MKRLLSIGLVLMTGLSIANLALGKNIEVMCHKSKEDRPNLVATINSMQPGDQLNIHGSCQGKNFKVICKDNTQDKAKLIRAVKNMLPGDKLVVLDTCKDNMNLIVSKVYQAYVKPNQIVTIPDLNEAILNQYQEWEEMVYDPMYNTPIDNSTKVKPPIWLVIPTLDEATTSNILPKV